MERALLSPLPLEQVRGMHQRTGVRLDGVGPCRLELTLVGLAG